MNEKYSKLIWLAAAAFVAGFASAEGLSLLYPSGQGDGPASCPTIGNQCADGTIYIGQSPDGQRAMFTTAGDTTPPLPWQKGQSREETIVPKCHYDRNTDSWTKACRTGRQNTKMLAGNDGVGTLFAAAAYCAALAANGHDDWYLPAPEELQVLYEGNHAIGRFHRERGSAFYWSSSAMDDEFAVAQPFWDRAETGGGIGGQLKREQRYVRCVRAPSAEN